MHVFLVFWEMGVMDKQQYKPVALVSVSSKGVLLFKKSKGHELAL